MVKRRENVISFNSERAERRFGGEMYDKAVVLPIFQWAVVCYQAGEQVQGAVFVAVRGSTPRRPSTFVQCTAGVCWDEVECLASSPGPSICAFTFVVNTIAVTPTIADVCAGSSALRECRQLLRRVATDGREEEGQQEQITKHCKHGGL